jgi:hypothetical protein
MGSISSMGMAGMSEMGGMDMVAGELEQAAGALQQAAGGLEQAASGMTGGAGQGASGGAYGVGGQQGGAQGLEQELSQTLQQLSQELQQLSGGPSGGGQPQIGDQTPSGGQGPASAQTPTGGGSQVFNGNEASALPDLQNLIVDSSGGSGGARPTHVSGDLDRLRGEVQTAMKNGQMSEQTGAKALADIGSGNVQAVEQDLTGTSGAVTPQAQANATDPINAILTK